RDRVERPQHGTGVSAAAAQAAAGGNALLDVDAEAGGPVGGGAERDGGAEGEVLCRRQVEAGAVELAMRRIGGDAHGVGELDAQEQRLELVIAAGFAGEHAEAQVELRLGLDAGGGGAHVRRSFRRRSSRAKYQAPITVMGTNESRWKPIAQLTALASLTA